MVMAELSFGPDQIKIASRAFDEAWVLVAPSVSARPEAIEAARAKLADMILASAQKASPLDAEKLRDEAIHLMLADLTNRRQKI